MHVVQQKCLHHAVCHSVGHCLHPSFVLHSYAAHAVDDAVEHFVDGCHVTGDPSDALLELDDVQHLLVGVDAHDRIALFLDLPGHVFLRFEHVIRFVSLGTDVGDEFQEVIVEIEAAGFEDLGRLQLCHAERRTSVAAASAVSRSVPGGGGDQTDVSVERGVHHEVSGGAVSRVHVVVEGRSGRVDVVPDAVSGVVDGVGFGHHLEDDFVEVVLEAEREIVSALERREYLSVRQVGPHRDDRRFVSGQAPSVVVVAVQSVQVESNTAAEAREDVRLRIVPANESAVPVRRLRGGLRRSGCSPKDSVFRRR